MPAPVEDAGDAGEPGSATIDFLPIFQGKLQDCDKIVGLPEPVHVCLGEPDLTVKQDMTEEAFVFDSDIGLWAGARRADDGAIAIGKGDSQLSAVEITEHRRQERPDSPCSQRIEQAQMPGPAGMGVAPALKSKSILLASHVRRRPRIRS
jgi:hypothetical protein